MRHETFACISPHYGKLAAGNTMAARIRTRSRLSSIYQFQRPSDATSGRERSTRSAASSFGIVIWSVPASSRYPADKQICASSTQEHTVKRSRHSATKKGTDWIASSFLQNYITWRLARLLSLPVSCAFSAQSFQADGGIVSHIKPQTLPSASLSTHYAFSTTSFDDVRTGWIKN